MWANKTRLQDDLEEDNEENTGTASAKEQARH